MEPGLCRQFDIPHRAGQARKPSSIRPGQPQPRELLWSISWVSIRLTSFLSSTPAARGFEVQIKTYARFVQTRSQPPSILWIRAFVQFFNELIDLS